MNRLLLLILAACFSSLVSAPALAASGRDLKREAEIEQQLREIDPALVASFRNARIAQDKNDSATAEALLRPLVSQSPGFDAGWRRLGAAVGEQGRRIEAITLMERAVSLKRSSANLVSLAYTLVQDSTPGRQVSEQERERALKLLLECKPLPHGDDLDILSLTAQIALGLNELGAAREATAQLQRKYPGEMATHYFSAFIAANDGHWIKAEDEILKARDRGLSAEATQAFLNQGVHAAAFPWRALRNTCVLIAAWALGLLALFVGGWVLSKLTLHQIERSDPRIPVTGGERRLRKIYRVVLNVAGIYYYISLPVVLLLVILVSASLVIGIFMVGHVPIYFTVMLIVGAIATVWSMLRSFFIRVKHEDPGEVLPREDATALWQLAEEVARTLHTRPVDEIRITTGTDLCVYERGSWRARLNNRAQRVLVLGAAVLVDFKQQDFRSVLAHEYGHFAHRDTAGGDIALRVRNDIYKFYLAMVQAEQNTRLNIAFRFLRLYDFLFRRISHGATRLQEVLADRIAAQTYGPAAFQGGLTHVIQKSIRFHAYANWEIKEAIDANRPVQNIYGPLPATPPHKQIEIEQALARPTTDDDTHPGPQDRFRLIATIPEPALPAPAGTVWDLFNNQEAFVLRLLKQLETHIAPHRPYIGRSRFD